MHDPTLWYMLNDVFPLLPVFELEHRLRELVTSSARAVRARTSVLKAPLSRLL